jgi:hypothetical protein
VAHQPIHVRGNVNKRKGNREKWERKECVEIKGKCKSKSMQKQINFVVDNYISWGVNIGLVCDG